MPTISLCMIVKNEEQVLTRCLESIKDAVDEIIIADTGSTDSTKEIAEKFTDKVFDFKWIDDFSAARNFAFSKASMDYIMWLDADDVVPPESIKKLIELKKNLNLADTVMMKYNTAFDENGNPVFSYYRERIVKNSKYAVWKGRVHEAIEPFGYIIYSDIEINHFSIKTHYSRRNLNIYEKQLDSGEEFSPRDTFYYGRELYYHNHFEKAIQTLTKFLKDKDGFIENKIEACKILSYCHRTVGNTDEALNVLFTSFLFGVPRAEICCDAGNLFVQNEKYKEAIFWYRQALQLPLNDKNSGFNSIDTHGYLPCIQLCVCYDKLGEYEMAEKYNNMAGVHRKSAGYLHNKEYFSELHKSGII